MISLPEPPKLGPPENYLHAIWFTAKEDEPIEWYDELDASRWSTRCVRKYRDGRLEAFSYAGDNWRDNMPGSSLPLVEVINQNPAFFVREISRDEFEDAWSEATSQMGSTKRGT
jgi:hypothetical protein